MEGILDVILYRRLAKIIHGQRPLHKRRSLIWLNSPPKKIIDSCGLSFCTWIHRSSFIFPHGLGISKWQRITTWKGIFPQLLLLFSWSVSPFHEVLMLALLSMWDEWLLSHGIFIHEGSFLWGVIGVSKGTVCRPSWLPFISQTDEYLLLFFLDFPSFLLRFLVQGTTSPEIIHVVLLGFLVHEKADVGGIWTEVFGDNFQRTTAS